MTYSRQQKALIVTSFVVRATYWFPPGPTEAINGRLEDLRGSALGFRNLTNYIA